MKKISLIIINILAVVILLTACNVTETDDTKDIVKPTAEPTGQPTKETSPTPSPTASPTPSPTKEPKDALIGEWEEMTSETIMKISQDGKVYHNDEYVADIIIIDNELVEYTTNDDTIFINYEIVDGNLRWGTNFECLVVFARVD